jgi:hypothetical protein
MAAFGAVLAAVMLESKPADATETLLGDDLVPELEAA